METNKNVGMTLPTVKGEVGSIFERKNKVA